MSEQGPKKCKICGDKQLLLSTKIVNKMKNETTKTDMCLNCGATFKLFVKNGILEDFEIYNEFEIVE